MHTYRLIYTWLSDFQNDCVECNSSIAESKCFSELTLVLSIYRDTAPSLSKMTIHVGFFPIVPSIHINILASIKEVDLPPPPLSICVLCSCVWLCGCLSVDILKIQTNFHQKKHKNVCLLTRADWMFEVICARDHSGWVHVATIQTRESAG